MIYKTKMARWLLVVVLWVVACGAETADPTTEEHGYAEVLTVPALTAVSLNGDKLQVVATTSVIGDVVAQVGGDAIQLTTLMGPGQDSHSYEPGAEDLTAVAEAHILFVSGWNLEESLLDNLAAIAEDTPIVPISANLEPLEASHEAETHADEEEHANEDEHAHEGADPHTWLDPHNVLQWVDNVVQVFSTLDPANTAVYQQNATAYKVELESLIAYYDEQLAVLPVEQRKLVTNHDAFAYFAARYNFELIGTVIPSISTLAEPSASGLAELVEAMKTAEVCTLFAETSTNAELAQAAAAELTDCPSVEVLTLYTESIGAPGSNADSYIGMMRVNIDTLIAGLK